MRKYLFLIVLILPVVAAAQPKKQWVKLLSTPTVRPTVRSHLLRATAMANLNASRHPHVVSNLLLRQAPARSKRPKLNPDLVLLPKQYKELLSGYAQTLQEFDQLRQEVGPVLFYQSFPLEARNLAAQEKRYWLEKMLPLYRKLSSLNVNIREDDALKYALEYVHYGVETVDPNSLTLLSDETKPFIVPFDPQTFFLYPPDTPLPEPSAQLEGKHIFILNDDFSLLRYFDYLAKIGVLFPGATLHSQGDSLQLLLQMEYDNIHPDLIFTDIQLGEHNGYFVAQELRRRGYKGGIIALTSYTETEEYAQKLKAFGFDGLISLDAQYYGKIPFCQRVTQAAQVYFMRKQTP